MPGSSRHHHGNGRIHMLGGLAAAGILDHRADPSGPGRRPCVVEFDQDKVLKADRHIQVCAQVLGDEAIGPGIERAKLAGIGAMLRLGAGLAGGIPAGGLDLDLLPCRAADDPHGNGGKVPACQAVKTLGDPPLPVRYGLGWRGWCWRGCGCGCGLASHRWLGARCSRARGSGGGCGRRSTGQRREIDPRIVPAIQPNLEHLAQSLRLDGIDPPAQRGEFGHVGPVLGLGSRNIHRFKTAYRADDDGQPFLALHRNT